MTMSRQWTLAPKNNDKERLSKEVRAVLFFGLKRGKGSCSFGRRVGWRGRIFCRLLRLLLDGEKEGEARKRAFGGEGGGNE